MSEEEQPAPPRQISHPKVVQVSFENQGGDWAVIIDDGSEKPFITPLEDDLVLQFMPVKMTSIMRAKQAIGVACLVLEKVPEDEEEQEGEPDAKPQS